MSHSSHIMCMADQLSEKRLCSLICLSGAHLGKPVSFRLTHNGWSAGIQMYGHEKENTHRSISAPFSPLHSLPVFTDLSMSFGSVSDILSLVSYTGFLALWESKSRSKINPVPLDCSVFSMATGGHLYCSVKRDLQRINVEFLTWEMVMVC